MAEVAQPVTEESFEPDISHLVIEDGEPVDNIFSEKQQQILVESLQASLPEDLRPCIALANVGLFASPHQPPLVPDVLVTFGTSPPGSLDEKQNKTYLIWNFGRAPDIVFEIVSNKEGKEDTEKLEKYAEWRVSYYVIYDPFAYLGSRPLRTFRLSGNRYVELLDPYKIDELNLGFTVQKKTYHNFEGSWLRLCDENGEILLTGIEKAEQMEEHVEAAERRADTEKQRADTEKHRAETAEQRAEKLAARLRVLGEEV